MKKVILSLVMFALLFTVGCDSDDANQVNPFPGAVYSLNVYTPNVNGSIDTETVVADRVWLVNPITGALEELTGTVSTDLQDPTEELQVQGEGTTYTYQGVTVVLNASQTARIWDYTF